MTAWESELASFMTELSSVQNETLEVLSRKRECLASVDVEGLAALAGREDELLTRLQACLTRRAELLENAEKQGLPSASIGALAKALPSGRKGGLGEQVKEANGRTRLLQHHSLTNWVVVQRTLLHLSQMLEIIATGGKKRPTYSKEESANDGGALVDRVA
jgi:flagellar biosynthesis/type III secretory pathway chaperone